MPAPASSSPSAASPAIAPLQTQPACGTIAPRQFLSHALADFDDGFSLVVDGANKPQFTVARNATTKASALGPALTLGQAAHIVAVYTGAELRLYLNGIRRATVPYTGGITWASTRDLRLASQYGVVELDEQHRLTMHFGRTVHEGCNRAAFYEHGNFATEYGSDHRCLVKLGCKGPVVKCNVPIRGWQSGVGGCPNVGGICMACTMPGFPDKYMPFMDEDAYGKASASILKFTYGPIVRYMRRLESRDLFA